MATPIRKALISAFGDVSNLSVVDATIFSPSKNEVQLKVLYSGFSGADVSMRQGWYPLQRAAPLTPGYSLVGRVVASGPGSNKYKSGTLIGALTVYDAQSTLLNIEEKHLVPVPEDLDTDDGHQQPTVHRAANVQAGQRVFIHGLSGAVGYATTALCLLLGADVYGTASARNHLALEKLGVKRAFVYTDKEWMAAMRELGGAHAVFDPPGFESWDESYQILADKCDKTGGSGILVGYGGNKGALEGGDYRLPFPNRAKLLAQNLKMWSRKKTNFYYIDRSRASFVPDLTTLMIMVREGKIRIPIKGV